MARYQVIMMTESLPGQEEAYCKWCEEQHFPDIMRIPGVISAERVQLRNGEEGAPGRYLSIFRTDQDPSLLMAEMVRRNGTPEMPAGSFHNRAKVQAMLGEVIGEWGEAQ
jgi:hypothetical protein